MPCVTLVVLGGHSQRLPEISLVLVLLARVFLTGRPRMACLRPWFNRGGHAWLSPTCLAVHSTVPATGEQTPAAVFVSCLVEEQLDPDYDQPNQSVFSFSPDLLSNSVRCRIWYESDRQELPRYARVQRISIRQHVSSRFRGPEEHGDGDDSARAANRDRTATCV
jgi:hypothetical protein